MYGQCTGDVSLVVIRHTTLHTQPVATIPTVPDAIFALPTVCSCSLYTHIDMYSGFNTAVCLLTVVGHNFHADLYNVITIRCNR